MKVNKHVRVMIIEDDEASVALILAQFKSWGIRNPVKICSDCEEAWKYLTDPKSDKPDLVFLDRNFQSSGMQGDDLLNNVLKTPELLDIKIAIMSTAEASSQQLYTYDRTKVVVSYIQKPLDPESLLKTVAKFSDEGWATVIVNNYQDAA